MSDCLFEGKIRFKEHNRGSGRKVEKRTIDTSSTKTEDGVFNDTESIKDGDDVDIGGQSKRQFDLPVDLVPPSEVGPENGGTPKRKRKERPKEEKALEAGLLENEDEAQKYEARADNRTQNFVCGRWTRA
ncbi:unnamed protein product [Prunus armeniaca]|uniref:Uncharacterized protein n=1 Tax=Prunus armeniaca TaxID=36596 RepID=A0A6J5U5H1_PRUAR|nr:unnamed protein product [Prunus armeniaca]